MKYIKSALFIGLFLLHTNVALAQTDVDRIRDLENDVVALEKDFSKQIDDVQKSNSDFEADMKEVHTKYQKCF